MRAEGNGKPVMFVLTAGQRHDSIAFEQLMEGGSIKRTRRGRPRRLPARIVGDKSYGSRAIRQYLRRKNICYTIPHKENERHGYKASFDKQVYRQRNKVERLFNRIKQFRRVATRYEKRAENYKAMLTIAAILVWL